MTATSSEPMSHLCELFICPFKLKNMEIHPSHSSARLRPLVKYEVIFGKRLENGGGMGLTTAVMETAPKAAPHLPPSSSDKPSLPPAREEKQPPLNKALGASCLLHRLPAERFLLCSSAISTKWSGKANHAEVFT